MIPALIIWLYSKYILKSPIAFQLPGKKLFRMIAAKFALILLLSLPATAEERVSTYNIRHNGNLIGQLNFSGRTDGNDIYLKLNSLVRARFLVNIDVRTTDQSHFSDGTLISSNVLRIVNGREKENKRTSLNKNFYQLLSGTKISRFDRTISYNMMMLYYREPLQVTQIYSDNFQKFIPLRRTASHTYEVELPDGNRNEYHFENGICKLVVLHHAMYTVKMELTKNI